MESRFSKNLNKLAIKVINAILRCFFTAVFVKLEWSEIKDIFIKIKKKSTNSTPALF